MSQSLFQKKLLCIINGGNLSDKLINISLNDYKNHLNQNVSPINIDLVPNLPGRNSQNQNLKKTKFPKVGALHINENKAKSLHFFANHELLAIEMMCYSLLVFPDTEKNILFKKGVIKTICDEQKHFKLYIDKMKSFGMDFGDINYNFYFWNFIRHFKNAESYSSIMSLTFESANLDFANFYQMEFEKIQEFEISDILKEVLIDEISHVSLGASYLNNLSNKQNNNLWDIYKQYLPFPLTPARAKGMKFYKDLRTKAGLPQEFIHHLETFTGDFSICHRKDWKKNQSKSNENSFQS